MTLHLSIPTDNLQVAFDLISLDHTLRPGTVVTAPGGATLKFERAREGPGRSGSLEFDLSGAGTGQEPVEVDQLASWLATTLQGRVDRVRLGGSDVKVEPDALRKVLAAHLPHMKG